MQTAAKAEKIQLLADKIIFILIIHSDAPHNSFDVFFLPDSS